LEERKNQFYRDDAENAALLESLLAFKNLCFIHDNTNGLWQSGGCNPVR